MSFVLPGCRSNFSLLRGTAFPEELAARAEKAGLKHLGLADDNNLYAAIDFHRACRDKGVNPLIGVRLTTLPGELHLIACEYGGYQNLCRLVTIYQLEGKVSPDALDKNCNDVICLAGAGSPFDKLTAIFGNNLFLSVDGSEDHIINDIIRRYDILPVANPAVSYLNHGDYRLHRLLRAIDIGALVNDPVVTGHSDLNSFFPTEREINHRFRHIPEAVANGFLLANRCRWDFPAHKNLLPLFGDQSGDKSEMLYQKSIAGLRKKKPHAGETYFARLDFELEIIRRTGFVDYFLVVNEIVDFCREAGIPVVGRGSAAGSLVAYSLGITEVDPIREKLYFERFLNEARSDPPDIDLDIDWRRRDDVLSFIYQRYGADRTAMIATYTRFRSRMAVREVAKANGLSPDEINRLCKRLPRTILGEIIESIGEDDLQKASGEMAVDSPYYRYRHILHDAARLDNFPRHLGIHAGGIVITPAPLTDYVALEKSTKGIVVTQCDMYQAEKLGLVKIDILGQRGLAVIADCFEHAQKIHEKKNGDEDRFSIPENDAETYRFLRTGKTIGVFQIESPGLRALLRDLKPKELNDITLALALIRPGASDSGMKQVFLDRHHGKEKTTYPHPLLENILAETFGVFIYQEQVLLCARAVAGFNLPAADLLRRAITKARHKADYRKLRRRFRDGARKNSVPDKKIDEIFDLLKHFAGFGFCKAHAATYGFLAYQSAYFKVHYPELFMRSVLNNDGGYYRAAVYIAEARRMGMAISPPDINLSDRHESLDGKTMYVGLTRVRELTRETIDQIVGLKPFTSFDDFLGRVKLSAVEAENLIKIGAFDKIDDNRPRLLWRLQLGLKSLRGRRQKKRPHRESQNDASVVNGDIFSGRLLIPRAKKLPPLPDFTPLEVFLQEREILGISASRHPLYLFPAYDGIPAASLLKENNNSTVSLCGWLVDIKRIRTREKKEPMYFLTFEDMEDTFEVVLFPEKCREYSELIRRYRFFRIDGQINIDGGNVAIVADKLSPASTGLEEREHI